MIRMTAAERIAQLEDVIRQQMAEIAHQRTEIDTLINWIQGDGPDALAVLQRAYTDPRAPEGHRLRAAGLALPFEKSKPASVNVNVDLGGELWAMRMRHMEAARQRYAEDPANGGRIVKLPCIDHQVDDPTDDQDGSPDAA